MTWIWVLSIILTRLVRAAFWLAMGQSHPNCYPQCRNRTMQTIIVGRLKGEKVLNDNNEVREKYVPKGYDSVQPYAQKSTSMTAPVPLPPSHLFPLNNENLNLKKKLDIYSLGWIPCEPAESLNNDWFWDSTSILKLLTCWWKSVGQYPLKEKSWA